LGLCSGRGEVGGAFLLELRILGALALYAALVLFAGFLQGLFLGCLSSSAASGSFEGAFLSIAAINTLASAVLMATSHVVFNVSVPLHARRCELRFTWECQVTRVMAGRRLQAALALFPVFMLSMMVGSMARLGLPVTPSSLSSALAFGVRNGYGLLELGGYMLAYTAPLLGGNRARLALALASVAALTAGAFVEAGLMLGPARP